MIRISKIIFSLIVLILIAWQLPWCYSFFFVEETKSPFTMYSSVCDDFISIQKNKKNKLIGKDSHGKEYSMLETDSLLPFFYMRQLLADNRFPDSIHGVAITPRDVQLSNFNFRTTPRDINYNAIALYPLFEDMSGRVDLKMPEDVFRITDKGIEFILMASNEIDAAKSDRFTKMMKSKGFVFPAQLIAGNPTTRKDYDEGYLVTDAEGKLFHLKQMRGRPYVRPITIDPSIKIEHLFVTEFKDKKTLGFIVDNKHQFYVLNHKSYEVINTGIEAYNPKTDGITIFGNMFDWTIAVVTDKGYYYYAIDATSYQIIKKLSIIDEVDNFTGLHFTSYKDKFVKPRFN